MDPKHTNTASPGSSNTTASRRREMRFDPPPSLRCSLAGSTTELEVRDIGIGGLAIITSDRFAPGRLYEFALVLGPLTVVQSARLIHGRQIDDRRWIYGFEFLKEATQGATIAELLDVITGSSIEFS